MATIRDVMHEGIISVAPSSTVAEAATVMGGKHVGSALVMEGDTVIGIFTERDIVRALSQDFDAPGHQVSHWMTADPTMVGPDMSVEEALGLMRAGGFRHLPVREGDRVVGMVSIRDLAGAGSDPAGAS
jgi:CBS domain-containing protein